MPIALRFCRLTAPSSKTPVRAARKNGDTPIMFMPLEMSPSVIVPRTAPMTLPTPPESWTPPRAIAVTEVDAERLAHRGIARRDAAGQIDAGDRASDRTEHVAGDPRRRDADAAHFRALRIGADGEDAKPKPRAGRAASKTTAMAATHQKNPAGNTPTLDFADGDDRAGTTPPAPDMNSNENPCTNVMVESVMMRGCTPKTATPKPLARPTTTPASRATGTPARDRATRSARC